MTIGKSHFHIHIKIKSYYSFIIVYESSICEAGASEPSSTGNAIETSWKENDFLHELSSLPNYELKRIPVSMWLRHKSETKMSLIDVRNLNKSFKTGYGQRECTRHKGLQTYFGPRYCYRPLMNPKYGEG